MIPAEFEPSISALKGPCRNLLTREPYAGGSNSHLLFLCTYLKCSILIYDQNCIYRHAKHC